MNLDKDIQELMNYSAVHYARQYINEEKKFINEFQKFKNQKNDLRLSMIKASTYFKIVKNLQTKYEGKKQRFEPIIDIIYEFLNPINDLDSAINLVKIFEEKLEKIYNNQLYVFSSKILWLFHKEPIIIIDKHVRNVLKEEGHRISESDIKNYYILWMNLYNENIEYVNNACKILKNIEKVTCYVPFQTNEINSICEEEWFKQRVFDIYLWFMGSKSKQLYEIKNISTQLDL